MTSAGTGNAVKTGRRAGRISPAGVLVMAAFALFYQEGDLRAATIYVDSNISLDSCPDYSTASKACGGGSEKAFKTFASASAATVPGDLVLVRGGRYASSFTVRVSGDNAAGRSITYRAYDRVNEPVTITSTGSIPALLIEGKNNVIIDGFDISNVLFWSEIIDGYNNVIRNCSFAIARDTGTRSGLKIIRGGNNKILNNSFDDGNDELLIEDSNRNLIEGNRFTKARHVLLNISCGNHNVVRKNYFSNVLQKAAEEFDCEGVISSSYHGDRQIRKYHATKHNLWEMNTFAFTKDNRDRHGPYNGIQYAGQNGLVRRNLFYNTQGGGVDLTQYTSEANHCYAARIFHNVFYNNTGGGIVTSNSRASATSFWDNRMVNNILYKNLPMPLKWADNRPGGSQATNRSTASGGFRFENNNILGQAPGEETVIYLGRAGRMSLKTAEARYSEYYTGNFELDPGFEDAANRDFRLRAGSRMIDRGAFLTATRTAGSGTFLPVADVGYFFDGYGIPGEEGDLIQLQGQTRVVRVIGIDYANHVLRLDRALTWSAKQGVSLAYRGVAPDIGAFEHGVPMKSRVPLPATNRINE